MNDNHQTEIRTSRTSMTSSYVRSIYVLFLPGCFIFFFPFCWFFYCFGCHICPLIVQFSNFPNSSFLPVLQFQVQLTSENIELPVLTKPPLNPWFLEVTPTTWPCVLGTVLLHTKNNGGQKFPILIPVLKTKSC